MQASVPRANVPYTPAQGGAAPAVGSPAAVNYPTVMRRSAVNSKIDDLKYEFEPELRDIGLGAERVAGSTLPSVTADEDKRAEDEKVKFNGEVRYSYSKNGGSGDLRHFDSRLRVRLYGKVRLNDDWAAYAMIEGNKHFLDYGEDDYLSGHRLYVKGQTGIATITAGEFGYLMGDGNIYDSNFKGVRADFDYTPWSYTVAAGRTSAGGDAFLGTATYRGNNFDVEGGLYNLREDNWGNPGGRIFTLGGQYYVGKFLLSAMYLGADYEQGQSGKNGFVAGVKYRKMKSWKPWSYELYAKYYYQPRSTYIVHTMNGLGGQMDGFKGFGIGGAVSVAPEVVLSLEYYHLHDLFTDNLGRTIWLGLSYYF